MYNALSSKDVKQSKVDYVFSHSFMKDLNTTRVLTPIMIDLGVQRRWTQVETILMGYGETAKMNAQVRNSIISSE